MRWLDTFGRIGATARRRALGSARAVGASALLTMRLFDLLPETDPSPRTAIVRDLPLVGRFDPRERLPNGMVLTLPLIASATKPRPTRAREVELN
jgi:hypothetical protein